MRRWVLVLCLSVACGVALFPATHQLEAQATDEKLILAASWALGNSTSLAAVAYEKIKGESAELTKIVEKEMKKAATLSEALGLGEVAALPAKTGEKAKDSAAALAYMLNKDLGSKIKKAHGEKAALCFEFAIKANTLLILYLPNDEMSTGLSTVLKDRGARIGFPESVWKPLTDKIDTGASYDEVKNEVFDMHNRVRAHLK